MTEVYVPSAVRPVVPAGRKRVASAPLELVRTIDTNGKRVPLKNGGERAQDDARFLIAARGRTSLNLVAPIERLGMAGERGVVVGWCLVNMRGGTVVSPKLGQA